MTAQLLDWGIILALVVGIALFRSPRRARLGNAVAALALSCAFAFLLARHTLVSLPLVLITAGVGAAVGWIVAVRIPMIQIPGMVGFQNGMGGLAAALVSFVELTRAGGQSAASASGLSAWLGLVVGAATFSGSMVACGKLSNWIRQTPTTLPRHNTILATLAGSVILVIVLATSPADASAVRMFAGTLAVVSIAMGMVFSIRVGGADMPVLISFLNTMSALAAALCGIAIHNRLLVVCGATVAASGSFLTYVMCRAMNRGLAGVFTGIPQQEAIAPATGPTSNAAPAAADTNTASDATTTPAQADAPDPFEQALATIRAAKRVIIVPGYGMALADAQDEVARLAETLAARGANVLFAIHPVAGRMPGHMHVLLAEAEVDYGMIRELKDVNSEFASTDLALVVGACDVVNPAAIDTPNTPISGMPVLCVHEARAVIVCNLDERPGYSGVPNPLYQNAKTILLVGDAKATVARVLDGLG
ncbi:MAG: NAD(P)(+) transhydrogenase (Re/Si-specific) subunit beta [Phycisphaerae bacterium]|nr:NAD(P)(+) transhydrogenase (Re/Si-specific) subunit beta [Phycisphaerae bacterium]